MILSNDLERLIVTKNENGSYVMRYALAVSQKSILKAIGMDEDNEKKGWRIDEKMWPKDSLDLKPLKVQSGYRPLVRFFRSAGGYVLFFVIDPYLLHFAH